MNITLPKTDTAAPADKKDAPAELLYQSYTSSRISTQLITDAGRGICFANYQFITADENLIEYLDSEIAKGIKVITKGKPVTSADLDPMAALRAKIIEEYEEQKEQDLIAAAKGNLKDMGKTEGASSLNALQAKNVAK